MLAVKENQGRLYDDVSDLFEGAEEAGFDGVPHDYATTLNKGHGRIERRECWSVSDPACLEYLSTGKDWPGLRSVVKVVGRRETETGATVQSKYYINSLAAPAEQLLGAARAHWSIENSLHWSLDVTFREDQCQPAPGPGVGLPEKARDESGAGHHEHPCPGRREGHLQSAGRRDVKLLRALASVERTSVKGWAESQGYGRYLGSSIKGESAIDWSDKKARTGLLGEIVADADRLLEVARQAQGTLPEGSAEREGIVAAAELLGQLLHQDVERAGDGIGLKVGVSKDRMMSVHDPEMRHGHKSSSSRFDGHKAAIVVDTDTQLITAVEVLPGNAPDNLGALELVERSEANTGIPVEEALGDAAYGDGITRQAFADAGRTLIARVPGRPNKAHFPKEDFRIDLEAGTGTCPAGEVARSIRPSGTRTGPRGQIHQLKGFRFDGVVCGACPLWPRCVAGSSGLGRTVQLHPQEDLLQQARALQQSEAFAGYRQWRVVVEHRLTRLVQLGIRQARYFGRARTRFQLYLAATVANLTLVEGKAGLTGDIGGAAIGSHAAWANTGRVTANFGAIRIGQIWPLALLTLAFLPVALLSTKAFHPHF